MNSSKIKLIQELMNSKGAGLKVDGRMGEKTRGAICLFHKLPDHWDDERLLVGSLQVFAIKIGAAVGIVDGYWGKKTQAGYEELLLKINKKTKKIKTPSGIVIKNKSNSWPKQSFQSMVDFYGGVGENQTSLLLPYPMRLAWDLDVTVKKITCHKKCSDSFERIFAQTKEHYGMAAIKGLHLDRFGGCLNVRKVRGGSSWSIHSWGAAIDIDPDRNRLRWGSSKAFLDNPEYDLFWNIVESEGGVSLGRERNYDWMHMQMARL